MVRKIAIIGSRGIPARYGGFETFADYLSKAMAKKGYETFVSCEYSPEEERINNYHQVNLFYFPVQQPQSGFFRIFYEFFYDLYSMYWASRKADIIYMLGYSASFTFFIAPLFGKKLLVNPDGLEWRRKKFGPVIKFFLKLSERMMVLWSEGIIADSNEIKKYLDHKYNINSYFIPYGVLEHEDMGWNSNLLDNKLKNIEIGNYLLVISRLEPENNIEMIIDGFLKSEIKKYLIVVGEFNSEAYEALIEDLLTADEEKSVIFTGAIYNSQVLNMLKNNCYAYLHGHSVGGTNPSLLEAMVKKNIIIAHDNEFNREVCGDFGFYFKDSDDLKDKINLIENNYSASSKMKEKVYHRVKENYSWDEVIKQYTELFEKY